MDYSPDQFPQLVSSTHCFSCDVCCRFPEKDSFLRPYFSQLEVEQAVKAGISPDLFADPQGGQITLVKNPQADAEGYLCPCFDLSTGKCGIYEVRPLDCQIYPLALMRDRNEENVLTGLDTKCPYVEEKLSKGHLKGYVRDVAQLLDASPLSQEILDNPALIHPHQEDVVMSQHLPKLTQGLPSKNE